MISCSLHFGTAILEFDEKVFRKYHRYLLLVPMLLLAATILIHSFVLAAGVDFGGLQRICDENLIYFSKPYTMVLEE